MTPCLTAVATIQPVGTCLSAATFGACSIKVVGFAHFNDLVGVTRAAQCESFTDRILGSEHVDNLLPHIDATVCLCVADQVHSVLGPAQ